MVEWGEGERGGESCGGGGVSERLVQVEERQWLGEVDVDAGGDARHGIGVGEIDGEEMAVEPSAPSQRVGGTVGGQGVAHRCWPKSEEVGTEEMTAATQPQGGDAETGMVKGAFAGTGGFAVDGDCRLCGHHRRAGGVGSAVVESLEQSAGQCGEGGEWFVGVVEVLQQVSLDGEAHFLMLLPVLRDGEAVEQVVVVEDSVGVSRFLPHAVGDAVVESQAEGVADGAKTVGGGGGGEERRAFGGVGRVDPSIFGTVGGRPLDDGMGVVAVAVEEDKATPQGEGNGRRGGQADGAQGLVFGEEVEGQGAVAFVRLMVGGGGGHAAEWNMFSHVSVFLKVMVVGNWGVIVR